MVVKGLKSSCKTPLERLFTVLLWFGISINGDANPNNTRMVVCRSLSKNLSITQPLLQQRSVSKGIRPLQSSRTFAVVHFILSQTPELSGFLIPCVATPYVASRKYICSFRHRGFLFRHGQMFPMVRMPKARLFNNDNRQHDVKEHESNNYDRNVFASVRATGKILMDQLLEKLYKRKFSVRMLSVLIYTLPLLDTLQTFLMPLSIKYGHIVNEESNLFKVLFLALRLYNIIPSFPFLLFTACYLLIVKNKKVVADYPLKFHTMTALILSMGQYAFFMVYSNLFSIYSHDVVNETFFLALFFSLLMAIGKSMLFASIGKLPELPVITEAVFLHIGDAPEHLKN